MKTKKVLRDLRRQHGLSQEEMAAKLFVTRQAVSRWETGESIPNTETLKIISKEFAVSINTILGQPVEGHCQACGMPLDEKSIAHEPDGSTKDYCQWCWTDGKYVGPDSIEGMIEVCVPHMKMPPRAARKFLRAQLPMLEHWRKSE